jgi:two-component system sensor histidine kinase PilS (NtrC family)
LQPRTPAAEAELTPRLPSPGYYASHWRSLDYFNLYRLTLAAVFSLFSLAGVLGNVVGQHSPNLLRTSSILYLGAAALFVLTIRARNPNFRIQLTAHIFTDIAFITLMMYASGGVTSGLSLLLLASLASGGLVGEGRLVLFYAAVASVATLIMQVRMNLVEGMPTDNLFQTGLLCIGYFSIAWLAHRLTIRALRSEHQAARRSGELDRLSRIHALVAGDLPDGIMAVDNEGKIFYSNPAAWQLIGGGRLPDAGESLLSYAPSLSSQWLKGASGDGRLLNLSGRRLLPHYHALPNQEGTIILLEDIQRREQHARQQKLAALGQLTANIAHEIRNPLSAIRQAAQLLHEETADETSHKLTSMIESNVRRLDSMVNDVLMLNRRDRLQPETLSLQNFVPAWLKEWLIAEEMPKNAVIISMEDSLSPVCFDPQHLRQILWNLARNAWRHGSHTPESVRLAVRQKGSELQIDIRDDGPGISGQNRERLFEPFFTTDPQGTGLGLYIARELAEANRARLDETGNDESGACFRLSLDAGPCQ